MIVCRKCSRRHPDGTEFCVCGAYLEFDGEQLAEPSSPGDAANVAPAPPGPLAPPRPAWEAQRPGSAPARPSPAAEPAPWSGFEPAREPDRPPGGIDAVLPDAPGRAATTQPVWVEAGGREGDITCRQCGTPNGPERFFCRHCGTSLTGAVDLGMTPPPRRVPWWRRLFRRAKAQAASTDATTMVNRVHGLARGGMSGRTMLFRSGGVMVVLAGLLAFLGPWRGPVLAKGRELLGADRHTAIDVDPEEVSSVPTDPAIVPAVFELQEAGNVVDRFANTAWSTKWIGTGSGFEDVPEDEGCQPVPVTDSQLVFEFAEPRDIGRIRILGGRTDGDEARSLFARPRVVELRVDDGPCSYALLDDVGELFVVDVDLDDVETVTVGIVGIHAAEPPSEVVEISEIVFEE